VLVRLGDKSATHLDAIARASVKLLCRVPADEHEEQEAPREEDQVSSALSHCAQSLTHPVTDARRAHLERCGTIAGQ
jgi:hypothetical protein